MSATGNGVLNALLALAWIGCAAALGVVLTGVVRARAISTALLDIPNERSSHSEAIPRGGGLAIAAVAALALVVLALTSGTSATLWALAWATVVLATLGWLDDRHGLSVFARFGVQLVVAAVIVALLGPVARVEIGGFVLELGILAQAFTVLWIVWLVNLYNFMDGIDGLASVEAVVAAGVMGAWFALAGAYPLALFALALAGACLGFLRLNWAPAKIFMGDVGSLTLGGVLATLTVAGVVAHDIPFGAFVIVLGVFVGDASVTLVRRLLRGENPLRAHRSHFYQRAVQAGWSHARVSAVILLINAALAALASAEALRLSPRPLWPAAALLILLGLAATVMRRESRTSVGA